MTHPERFAFNLSSEKMKSPCARCGAISTLRMRWGTRSGFKTPGIILDEEGEYAYQIGREFWYLSCDSCGSQTPYAISAPRMT